LSFQGRLKDSKGSALLPVLAVLLVISLIFTSIVFYGAWHKLRAQKVLLRLKAEYLAEAGVNRAIWYLSGNDGKDMHWRAENEPFELGDTGSYMFSVRNWGGYIAVESQGKAGAVQREVKALIGYKPSGFFDRAINLGDRAYPLVVAGSNRIVGDVLVGPAGVIEGKFKGEPFQGKKYVIGNVFTQSDTSSPSFSTAILEEFRENVSKNLKEAQSYDKAVTLDDHSEEGFFKGRKLTIDGNLVITSQAGKQFSGPGFVYCKRDIIITGVVVLESGLILASDGAIMVSDKVQVRDCILYSRTSVRLEGKSVFQGQVFAEGELAVKDDALVKYPALLCVKGKLNDKKVEGTLSFEPSEQGSGVLVYYDDYATDQLPTVTEDRGIVSVAKDSKFKGIVYSTNRTRQEGTVLGNITTNAFYFSYPPTEYINWLKSSVTDRTGLRREVVLPLIFNRPTRLEIAEYKVLN
jgi:hypothetical protein